MPTELLAVIPGLDSVADLFGAGGLPWRDWGELWRSHALGGRNAVLLFVPLLPILLLVTGERLKLAIVLTGFAFIGYVFGAAFLLLWLATCVIFYRLGEQFAIEFRRTDVIPWGPSLGAGSIIAGYFLLTHVLGRVSLPDALEEWVWRHTPWLLPLGARGVAWEPVWFGEPALLPVTLGRLHDVGVAYFTMKMVSYFAELKRGTIPRARRSLLNFLAYACFAPTFIQGPIERYRAFQDQIETAQERRTLRNFAGGLRRLLVAAAKTAVLLLVLGPWAGRRQLGGDGILRHPEQLSSFWLFFGIHVHVLMFYLIFSAYSDVAIGLSRLVGYNAAENFNRPWLARSLTDMWRRWHISLSFTLRDYFFLPLVKRRWPVLAALLVAFFLCGLWHSVEPGYVFWGLVMGLLVWISQRWTRWMRDLDRHPDRRLSRMRRAWLRLQPLPKVCAWLLTINVFCLTGWICWWDWGWGRVARELLRRIGSGLGWLT